MPFFSIIIPTYNRALPLANSIASVLSQAWSDFELIIVDDGSTDGTDVTFSGISDPRLIYLRQENRGVSSARNAGIAIAKGTWITFLDSDDTAKSNWLAEFASHIAAHENLGAVFCGNVTHYVDATRHKQEIRLPKVFSGVSSGIPSLNNAGTFVLRRDILILVGGYAEQLKYSENTELLWRVITYCNEHSIGIGFVELPLTNYYCQIGHRRAAHASYYQNVLEAVEYMLKSHSAIFRANPQLLHNYRSVAGVNAAKVGQLDLARKYFLQNLLAKPFVWKGYGQFMAACCPWLARIVWQVRSE